MEELIVTGCSRLHRIYVLDDSEVILNYLRNMGGSLPLGNLSTPEEIYKKLHISKSAFKRAVGHLYKLKLITIEDYLITLNE